MRSVKEWAAAWIFIAFAGSAVISLPTGGVWSVNMRPRTHRAFAIYNTPLGHRSNAFGRPKSSSQIEANISFGAMLHQLGHAQSRPQGATRSARPLYRERPLSGFRPSQA